MGPEKPRVSIGLPVYNGEQYLQETLESLLCQTFADFELIISDNASTDGTEAIARRFASQDPRIRYVRNEQNIGAAENYNAVFHMARGEYFKWAAHDDLCHPRYLETCVGLLDANSEAVIGHCKTAIIDERGNAVRDYDDFLDLRAPKAHQRLWDYFWRPAAEWNAIFGVMRTAVLAETPLIGKYIASDQTLLGEMVVRGRVYQAPQRLFFRRDHPANSWRANRSMADLLAWFDPQAKVKLPRTWKHSIEYLRGVHRARPPLVEWVLCDLNVAFWFVRRSIRDLRRTLRAKKTLPASGSPSTPSAS